MKKLLILVAALALAVTSCGGSEGGGNSDAASVEVGPADAGNGAKVYDLTCVACHGQRGIGIDGLGKPMPGSAFIERLSGDELAEFIREGRTSDDADNTTGIDMPAWGGNTNLNEQDLVDVVAFIRTL